jgi:hypothetical protein
MQGESVNDEDWRYSDFALDMSFGNDASADIAIYECRSAKMPLFTTDEGECGSRAVLLTFITVIYLALQA